VVWVVDPQRRTVEVFQPNAPIRVLREGDTLTGDPVLPDFQLPLGELFAEISE